MVEPDRTETVGNVLQAISLIPLVPTHVYILPMPESIGGAYSAPTFSFVFCQHQEAFNGLQQKELDKIREGFRCQGEKVLKVKIRSVVNLGFSVSIINAVA